MQWDTLTLTLTHNYPEIFPSDLFNSHVDVCHDEHILGTTVGVDENDTALFDTNELTDETFAAFFICPSHLMFSSLGCLNQFSLDNKNRAMFHWDQWSMSKLTLLMFE